MDRTDLSLLTTITHLAQSEDCFATIATVALVTSETIQNCLSLLGNICLPAKMIRNGKNTGSLPDMKKPVWDRKRPASLGKPKKLSPAQKESAKAVAAKAGRPYPNLVDNMRAARRK